MTTNKFESLLELLINEENDKAEALFHEIVVEKSRDIYEGLADEEVTAEAKEENKEEVKETTDFGSYRGYYTFLHTEYKNKIIDRYNYRTVKK